MAWNNFPAPIELIEQHFTEKAFKNNRNEDIDPTTFPRQKKWHDIFDDRYFGRFDYDWIITWTDSTFVDFIFDLKAEKSRQTALTKRMEKLSFTLFLKFNCWILHHEESLENIHTYGINLLDIIRMAELKVSRI